MNPDERACRSKVGYTLSCGGGPDLGRRYFLQASLDAGPASQKYARISPVNSRNRS